MNKVTRDFPESWICKSDKQKTLEAQGCVFSKTGQELLDNHEIDPAKECYCGRPNKQNAPSGGGMSEWISVDNEMPGILDITVYIFINPPASTPFQAIGHYCSTKKEWWHIEGYDNSNAVDFITHWARQLPPPK